MKGHRGLRDRPNCYSLRTLETRWTLPPSASSSSRKKKKEKEDGMNDDEAVDVLSVPIQLLLPDVSYESLLPPLCFRCLGVA